MILDHTSRIVATEGVAGLSMERISREADISKSLMYRYFDSLTELLRELLQRELKSLRRAQAEAAESANTFEELVRNVTHQYLKYIDKRGLIIERLQAEPSVSDMNDPTDYGRTAAVEYLAEIVSKNFDMPIDIAKAATDISFGLPAAAGEYLLSGHLDLEQVEDLTVSMIIGAVTAARNDYLTKMKPFKR